MSAPSPNTAAAERTRRNRIAAAAYARGRNAAHAAIARKGLYERSLTVVRERPVYEPRSDSRAPRMLASDLALARGAAYLAAVSVAAEMVQAEKALGLNLDEDWSASTLTRCEVHEDAWRERFTDAGIDDAAVRPHLVIDPADVELPGELDVIDFSGIAEDTLDMSAVSADLDPVRLSDLVAPPTGPAADPTQHMGAGTSVADVIELDRGWDLDSSDGMDL